MTAIYCTICFFGMLAIVLLAWSLCAVVGRCDDIEGTR